MKKSNQALNCFLKGERKAAIEFNGRTLFFYNLLINPLKKSVDYKGLKSAGYRRINVDEKAKVPARNNTLRKFAIISKK